MFKLPKKVSIFGLKHKVKRIKELTHADGTKCDGLYSDELIEIDLSLEDKKMWKAYWHEVGHGVLDVTGLGELINPKFHDKVVDNFAEQFSKFIMDEEKRIARAAKRAEKSNSNKE